MIHNTPKEVREVLAKLESAGYDAYIVGGSVRDVLLQKTPNDWDLTTNATPEQTQEVFPDSFYENDFGTVGVKTGVFTEGGKEGRDHDVVEVTTYRIETTYSDRRRPDDVEFAQSLDEDLSRRDFTINALALDHTGEIVDLFDGQKDLQDKLVRAVGDANERFNEDALRMLRAVRFAAQLDFSIEPETLKAIRTNCDLLTHVSVERIQIEFSKIVMSDHAMDGIVTLQKTGLLKHIIPELEIGIGVEQNHHHIYDVWEHNLRALDTCPSKKLSVRLAALLHDVGKPESKEGKGRDCTFYNHEYIGERITRKILKRLAYPKKVVEHASLLVRNHMFYYSVDEVTEAAVRRVIRKVGLENIPDLIDVRIGDRLGSGTPKAMPYKLRHFLYLVEKVSKDPISVGMLNLNGDIMITEMDFAPGRQIGAILNVLLAEVIEDPKLNTLEHLKNRAESLRDEDLSTLLDLAKEKIETARDCDDHELRSKHKVK